MNYSACSCRFINKVTCLNINKSCLNQSLKQYDTTAPVAKLCPYDAVTTVTFVADELRGSFLCYDFACVLTLSLNLISYCCPDCPSCLTRLHSIDSATLAIQQYSLKLFPTSTPIKCKFSPKLYRWSLHEINHSISGPLTEAHGLS